MTFNLDNINQKHLTLNGRVFSYKDIIEDTMSLFELRSDFEFDTILFCKQWLKGETKFKINTSGSTGEPKPIIITREQMITSASLTGKFFNLEAGDSILVNLNSMYIGGIMMLVRGLHLNLNITVVEPSSNPFERIDSEFDFYAFVPLQLQTIIESNKSNLLQKAKAIIVGGAPISTYQENLFMQLKSPVYSTYGMTETCTHVALRKVGETNFKALEGVIFEKDENDCLIIESPTSISKSLVTNDVVDFISSTEFIWKGRADNIINSGGVKIQIEELESKIANALASNNDSFRFIVSSKSDDRLGQKVILISEKEISPNAIEKNLEPYERPKEYVVIKSFPETETGKVDRNKLLIMV